MGERRLKPQGIDESELDQAVYGGKKISRKDLFSHSKDDSDDVDEDMDDSEMDFDEDDDEEGESDDDMEEMEDD